MPSGGIQMAKRSENVQVAVEFGWDQLGRVRRDADSGLLFPSAGFVPAVYRFRVVGNGPERRYVGETSALRRRLQEYRTPGPSQRTNLRLNRLFRDHLEGGGQVDVDTADSIKLISGSGSVPVDLHDGVIRKLIESAALAFDAAAGFATMNL